MKLFDVYIINTLTDMRAIKEARAQLIQRFKLSPEKAEQILAKQRVIIKHGVDEVMAEKLQQAIHHCGLQAELVERNETASELEIDPPLELQESNVAAIAPSNGQQNAAPANAYQSPNADMAQQVFCRQCGNKMSVNDPRCSACGAAAQLHTGPSKVVAGFLALFLGGFGIHRFYLRQWWGVFYIPFGIFSLTVPITIIEAIYFWACSKETWNRKYGHQPAMSAFLIVAIAVVPFIAVVGILAAIALPAYQDYTLRAKVSEGMIELREWSAQVEHVAIETDVIPSSASGAEIRNKIKSVHLQSIKVEDGGRVVGTFKPFANGSAFTLVLIPAFDSTGDDIVSAEWSCNGGTLPDKYRPASCRGGSDVAPPQSSVQATKTLRSSESGAKITVPRNWREGVAENDEASINAGDVYAEAYTLLIEEDDPDNYFSGLDDYVSTIEEIYLGSLDQFTLIDQGVITTNQGEEGVYRKFSAFADNYDIVYIIALYANNGRYYQVFTWSLQSRIETNEDTLWGVLKSFSLPL